MLKTGISALTYGMGFLCVCVCAGAQDADETIGVLEMLAQGYENHNAFRDSIYVTGRLYQAQYAEEGKSIPANKVIEPEWTTFLWASKDGKSRYERDVSEGEDWRLYVIDDGGKITNYVPNSIVRYYPTGQKSDTMGRLADPFMEHFFVWGTRYPDVATTARNLQEKIRAGEFSGEEKRIEWSVDGEGIFTVTVDFSKGAEVSFKIDSQKGYNLVECRRKEDFRARNWFMECTHQIELMEYAPGEWYPTRGVLKAVENDVVVERILEIEEVKTGDFDCPDDFFSVASLNIPREIYFEDFRFDPPLKVKPQKDLEGIEVKMEKLLTVDIDREDVAEVAEEGALKVSENTPYIETKAKLGGGMSRVVVILIILVLALGLAGSWYLLALRKSGRA